MDWRDQLFEERSLSSVFVRSPGLFHSHFNQVAMILVVTAVFLLLFYSYNGLVDESSDVPAVVDVIISWSEIGTTISASILGFLLAGFAIFASVTRPALFANLARIEKANTGLSELKYAFFSFMNVFIHYVSFLSFCLIVSLSLEFLVADSANWQFLPGDVEKIRISYVIFILVYSIWITVLILKLKSVIWNVYQIVLLSIADFDENV